MKIGIAIFPTDKSIQPVQLAKEVEDRVLSRSGSLNTVTYLQVGSLRGWP